jgi:hypothetical protein
MVELIRNISHQCDPSTYSFANSEPDGNPVITDTELHETVALTNFIRNLESFIDNRDSVIPQSARQRILMLIFESLIRSNCRKSTKALTSLACQFMTLIRALFASGLGIRRSVLNLINLAPDRCSSTIAGRPFRASQLLNGIWLVTIVDFSGESKSRIVRRYRITTFSGKGVS